uniref:D(3) dopamine receptor n=1 Tax=Sphenodon punctatus TaxID=8508 RepID=A0A8D0G3R3_SPHPU
GTLFSLLTPHLTGLFRRYTAVIMPVQYQYSTGKSSFRRVSIMIGMVWMLAFAVSCPLLFGFNTTGDPSVCSISNPDFVIYSSVVSFYLPFMVTLLLYVRIYIVLRQRQRKRILTRQGGHRINVKPCYKHKKLHHRHQDTLSSRLQLKSPGPGLSSEKKPLTPSNPQQYCSFCHEVSFSRTGGNGTDQLKEEGRTRDQDLEVSKLSNGKTMTSLKLTSQQSRMIQLRERKATQMLAIVLGTFIVCWMPFFLIHILNTHCQVCHIPPELYSATIWLGYVNSAINPVIYTTFNTEFRKAFLKILYC